MGPRLDRLAEIAGPPLGGPGAAPADAPAELAGLLGRVDGFYAFESALHVLAAGALADWNDPAGWRVEYGGMADGLFCFAEDLFGGQFAYTGDGSVVSFEPETGERQVLASSLEGWADRLLADYSLLTGYPLAHRWQLAHGALPAGQRLVPKTPFVLGGQFAVDNLYPLDAATGMRLRGELAVQIRDLPDGASVRYRVVE